jgi:hypothetical protein
MEVAGSDKHTSLRFDRFQVYFFPGENQQANLIFVSRAVRVWLLAQSHEPRLSSYNLV